MKTNLRSILLFAGGALAMLAVLALSGAFFSETIATPLANPVTTPPSSDKAEGSAEYEATSFRSATEITCTYPQTLSANYFEGKVNHELPPKERNPMIFTFANFSGDVATLMYIDATRTISETQLYKLSETPNKLVFIEGDGNAYLSTHTIFKDAGVSLYSKEVDLFGTPSGLLAMGTCVGI